MPRPDLEPRPRAGPAGVGAARLVASRPRRLAWLLGLTALAAVVVWAGVDRWSRPSWCASSEKSSKVTPTRPASGWTGWRFWGSAGSRSLTGGGRVPRLRATSMRRCRCGARIPAGASRFANATLRRARLAIDRGRLAVAEETLEACEARSRPAAPPTTCTRSCCSKSTCSRVGMTTCGGGSSRKRPPRRTRPTSSARSG